MQDKNIKSDPSELLLVQLNETLFLQMIIFWTIYSVTISISSQFHQSLNLREI